MKTTMKKTTILGAIAGDAIGSIYEFNPTKDYHFPLMDNRMEITDDSIMTLAVADWIMHSDSLDHKTLAERMRYWGRKYRYPMGSYGINFSDWLDNPAMGPYRSWGNGSAMRVSPVGFAFGTMEETLRIAGISAEVTHNHPEGIKGAQATAAAIFMARSGADKEEIRKTVTEIFGYRLDRTCDDIRPDYRFEASCQETVPQSIIAFLDSTGFEDAIRLTVSLGGDADTMGAITGGIAAAYYDMPQEIHDFTLSRIPADLRVIADEFENRYGSGTGCK